jgi:SAM-dependent methyltransferase
MNPSLQRRCDCQTGEITPLFAARDYISGDPFQIVQCVSCGLAFTEPVPREWTRYYPALYYGNPRANRFPAPVEWLQNRLYASRARKLEQLAGAGRGRVLDIGCGRGHLLRAFQRRGWEVAGTEMSELAAAYAREQLRLPVSVGNIAELNLPAGGLDVAIMWHVLEHFERVGDVLREVHRLLRPGGLCFIAVPNFGSLEARAARDKWFHLDVPRHLTHFTEPTLMRRLEQSGFRIETTSNRSLEYDFFSAVQSFLNRSGLRMNWLYSALRGGGAENVTQVLGHLVCIPAAGIFGLAALLAGGSTQVVYARKT